MNSKLIFTLSLLSIIVLWGTGCNTTDPTRTTHELPPSNLAEHSWEEILTAPTKIDSFLVLNTGSVKVPRKGMLNEDKLPTNHELPEQFWVDVFVFLFHHSEKGWYMIDSGLDSSFQKKGNIRGIFAGNYIKETRQKNGQNIQAQLKQLNIQPQGIFFTHLHGDHTAGLPELSTSITKYSGANEEYHDIPFVYNPNHLSKKDTIMVMHHPKNISIPPFRNLLDIFGDGSFLGISTPGHSSGHLSYLLITKEGPVLLTGDASHTKYGFQQGIEPGWTDNRKSAESSLAQLKEFSRLHPDVQVIYGHER
ncbi:MAG: MBL fold metallo-hydrolase [Bacteroidetes bacterium]|nr:MAG: MBL fold metallo-hydrolase [Bacteroidota bacterium]